ncbi:MAG: hypothetical protein ACYDCN_12795 [Bacteroidia bacterium]
MKKTIITVATFALIGLALNAQVIFYDEFGNQLKSFAVTETGAGQLNVYANDLSNGTYSYTLIIDGQIFATQKMIKQQ